MDTEIIKTKKNRIKKFFSNLFDSDNSYDKYNDAIKAAGIDTLRNKKGIHEPEDYLLKGDYESYGKDKYKKAPQVFIEAPEDMRVLPTFNSLMPDEERSSPALMTYRHLTQQIDQMVFDEIHSSSKKFTKSVIKTTTIILLGFVAFASYKTMTMPAFSLVREHAEYLTGGAYVKEVVVGFGAYFAQLIASAGIVPLTVLAATTFAFSKLVKPLRDIVYDYTFYSRLNKTWKNLKHSLTYHQNLPTRQGRLSSKEDEYEYVDETSKYMAAVNFATTTLKDDALIQIGTHTGLTASKGINFAQLAGTKMMIDMTTLRTHFLVLGDTGKGKTETGLMPTALQFVQKTIEEGRQLGVLVLCGKGVLALQFRDRLPAHLREKMYLCGTGEGGYGIDLLKSLSPNEIAEQFQNIALSIAKSPDSMKWISGAADRVRDAAEILYVVKNSPKKLDISDLWKDRPYSHYSLMGINALVTEVDMRSAVVARILENTETLPFAVVNAARNLKSFAGMAAETQASYLSNCVDVFSKISGVLAERFAYGDKAKGVKFVDLEDLDRGAIIGMGISAADNQAGGIIVNNLVKACAYTAAQKRDTAANRAREKLSRIDEEISGRSFTLINKKSSLTLIRAKLSDSNANSFTEVLAYLDSNYPIKRETQAPWSSYKKTEIMQFIIEKIEDTERDMARYTDDVKLIAQETLTLRRDAKNVDNYADVSEIKSQSYIDEEKIRDATSQSSVLIMMDEAHFFINGGNSITSDTFFLSIARSTGRIVMAGTQSLESIYSKMTEHEALSLLTNFGTKLVMGSSDPKTIDLVVQAFGTANADSVLAKNGFANYGRLLNKYPDVSLKSISFAQTSDSFNTDMNEAFAYGNSLHVSMSNYDAGHRDIVDAKRHEDNYAAAENEKHNRLVSQQAYNEELDKSGNYQPIIKPSDVSNLVYGQGFLITSRAGLRKFDKVVLSDTRKKAA